MFDFCLFSVMLVYMSIIYYMYTCLLYTICWQYQSFGRVLVCWSVFYYSKKWIKENVLSFVKKIKLNVQRHLKHWLWCLACLLWAGPKFNCSITGLRKAKKVAMTMLVLVARARQQPMKIIFDNRWITIRETIR